MNIFIAFANQDRDVRDKLLRQMNLVKDRLGWNIWSAKEIKAGERWDEEIKQRLKDSEVVILLLSTDFFNSKYIVETELPKVVEKHKKGDCQIIPVIARVCHWKDTSFGEYAELGDIQALPVGEKPIMSKGHWDHEDQPYFEVVAGLMDSIREWQNNKLSSKTKKADNPGYNESNDSIVDSKISTDAEIMQGRELGRRVLLERFEEIQKQKKEENIAWEKASNSHEVAVYESYLQSYPQGVMAREARIRIKKLEEVILRPFLGGVMPLSVVARWLWCFCCGKAQKCLAVEMNPNFPKVPNFREVRLPM